VLGVAKDAGDGSSTIGRFHRHSSAVRDSGKFANSLSQDKRIKNANPTVSYQSIRLDFSGFIIIERQLLPQLFGHWQDELMPGRRGHALRA
jgi:hypothetical protein